MNNPKTNATIESRFDSNPEAAEFLATLLANGEFGAPGAQSREFPEAIAAAVKTGKASAAQAFWCHKLASEGRPKPQASGVFNLAGVMALFSKAAAKLKRPAIVLALPGTGEEIKVALAGPGSKFAGQLMIASPEFGGAYYGRVAPTGEFFAGRSDSPAVRGLLTELATDAAACAAKHGHLTGRCAFCNRPLSDDKSTSVGYGPVCAEHFGLPWGAKVAAMA